jgi:hypothetical protein
MNKKKQHVIFSIITLWLAIVNCNAPKKPTAPEGYPTPTTDFIGTITAMAASPLATGTNMSTETRTPQAVEAVINSPTSCVPTVITNSPINVRSGPGVDYTIIGSLLKGGSAGVSGKSNDGTWWYIDFPVGEGGHGWISGSVVTTSCIPDSLAIIAAPPLPTKPPTQVPNPTSIGPSPVGPSPVGPSPVGPTAVK